MRRALELLRRARFAPPVPCADALAAIRAEHGVDFDAARVRAGFVRGHLLELRVFLPGGTGSATEQDAAQHLVRLMLGEELLERWIGRVSVTATVRHGPLNVLNSRTGDASALPLPSLAETVQRAIRGLCDGLTELAASPTADWFAFELEPDADADYAAQDDLVFCSTRLPESKKAFLRNEPFFSGRFTNSGALLTYLKYESSESSATARVSERTSLEGVIRQALDERQGVIVGLGLGLRYAYIDLALTGPDCVSERLFPALQAAGIPPRAWLLFCDSELEQEYRPVYLGSPAPHLGPPFGR